MSTEKFIKATAPVSVELNDKTYSVKPLSFRDYLAIQRALRNSFADDLTVDQKEDAYVNAIRMLAEALKLPVEEVLDSDSDFINRLVDVFLLPTKTE